jgi:hypothetical protein
MPIDNLHFLSDPEYKTQRDDFVAEPENRPLFRNGINGGILNDGIGHPTIGFGYDLAQPSRTIGEITAYLTNALGGTLTDDQQAGLDLLAEWKNGQFTNQDIINIANPGSSQGTAD